VYVAVYTLFVKALRAEGFFELSTAFKFAIVHSNLTAFKFAGNLCNVFKDGCNV